MEKLRWDSEEDPADLDEDDRAAFEVMRKVYSRDIFGRHGLTDSFLKDLRTFIDSVLVIDPSLVTSAVQTLAMNTLNAYQNGVAVKWNDAELAVYLVYIFGEINKCEFISIVNQKLAHPVMSAGGGKGRAAFCETPAAIDKDKRKLTDYSEFALTAHGQMLYTLVQSGISAYPHHTVTLQFFETTTRYTDFFKVRKECIMPTLHAMIDQRFVLRPHRPCRIMMMTNNLTGVCITKTPVSGHECSTSSTGSSKK